ncbi:hypothetical protein LRS10_00495 [Phenylobacterium sp. J426]|nr:hypothetical protein [Phenylobacterium sp. J426]MCR5872800.1 hypothetical protein [Phenylobacterium sp. J426]
MAGYGIGAAAARQRRHHHLVPGERAGLVRADHRDGTEGFYGRQAADDGVAARHRLDPDGQGYGEDSRETLWDGRDREPDDNHEELGEVLMADEVAIDEQAAGHQQDQDRQPAREPIHLSDERRGQGLDLREQTADAADLGASTGRHGDAARCSRGHQRSAERHAGPVADRRVGDDGTDSLVDRGRLAREDRFLDPQAVRSEKAQIGRNLLACLEQDDIARYDQRAVDAYALGLADDGALRRQHLADGIHGLFRPSLLDEADDRIGEDNREDHARVDQMAQGGGDDCGA